ncbi:peptidoglycan-binding protein LysM [Bdellovibrio bacteriovorus]|uniref:peptidoglycan-binding protein LysM n=1 Tax=Bdellovibrio bacteriovorus TaxID=959 RepID=UPI0035A8204D
MGLLSFMKNAGEKLFGTEAKANVDAIKKYIQAQGLSTEGLEFSVEGDKVKVSGKVADQETKEKIILCCGNVQGVESVEDNITVTKPADESQYHTVVSGDTLSKISQRYYGDAKKYNVIFDANRPMLSNPDKIYPGQKLRIPAQGPTQRPGAEKTL